MKSDIVEVMELHRETLTDFVLFLEKKLALDNTLDSSITSTLPFKLPQVKVFIISSAFHSLLLKLAGTRNATV